MSLVRVVSQNVKHGGTHTPTGAAQDRWPALAGLLRSTHPDILLLQETHGWAEHNHHQVIRAQHDLGLTVPVGTLRPGSSPLVMYNPTRVGLCQTETRYLTPTSHGFSAISLLGLDGGHQVAVASVHLPPDCAATAASAARRAAWRCRRFTDIGLLGGDLNHFPLSHPLDEEALVPDPETLPAPNVAGRWHRQADGTRAPTREVGHVLAEARYTNTAHHVASQRGDPALLRATAAGQLPVDQLHVTEPLVPAIQDLSVTHHEYSDHALLVLTLDTDHIDPSLIQVPTR